MNTKYWDSVVKYFAVLYNTLYMHTLADGKETEHRFKTLTKLHSENLWLIHNLPSIKNHGKLAQDI